MENKVLPLTTTNVNEAKERSPEAARVLSVLKYLGLAAIIIVAAMLMFVFLSSPVNGAIDSALEKAGIEPLTEAPVAYAWTSPGSSGYTSTPNWVSRLNNNTGSQKMQSLSFSPKMDSGSFSSGSISYAFSGYHSNAAAGFAQNIKKGQTMEILYFWDIKLDAVAKAAIANGQITSIVATVQSFCGTDNRINGVTFNGHYFICYGTASNDTLDGFVTKGSATYRLNKSGTNTDATTKAENLTISFSRSTTIDKIRIGVYGYIRGDGDWLSTPTANFNLPEVTKFEISSCYASGNLPQIRFAYGGEGAAGGTISGYNVNRTYKANYSTAATYSGGTNLNDVSVTVKDGYFFGGWGMSGGTISNVTNYMSKTINLSSGAYLNQSSYGGESNVIVLTAYFYKINISYSGTPGSDGNYTYLQQLNGNSLLLDSDGLPSPVAQGPGAQAISQKCQAYGNVGTSFVMYSGTYSVTGSSYVKNGSDYYYGTKDSGHSYKSISMPGDAGTYTFFFGVFLSGAGNSSSNCLGFYYETFTISSVVLSTGTVTGSSIDGETFTYTGNAITPSLEYVDFTVGGRPYRIHTDDIYGGFDNANNSYNNNVYTFNNTRNLSRITIQASSGNFSGTQVVTFTISQLSVGDTTIDPTLSAEIAERYKTVYTGYTLRPEVVLARVVDGFGTTHVLYATGTTNDSLRVYYPDDSLPSETSAISTYSIRKATNGQAIYYDNTEVSQKTAYFEIDVTGNLTGTVKVYFDIVQLNLNDLSNQFPGANISVTATYEQTETPTYNGYPLTPVPTVASITITGIPHYVLLDGVYQNNEYAITYYFVNSASASDAVSDHFSNPVFSSWNGYFGNPESTAYANNTNVKRDAQNNVVAGASVTLALSADTGSVTGTCTTTFKILPFDLSGTTAGGAANSKFGPIAAQTYSGEALEPAFNVYANGIAGSTEKLLAANTDYTYVYDNNVNVTDSATVTVTGKNNYTGTVLTNFTINPLNASNASIADLSATFVYSGSQIAPQKSEIGALSVTVGGKQYTLGTDQYDIAEGLGTNLNASPASDKQNYVMITFINNFYSSSPIRAYFTISPKDLANITVEQSWASWVNHKDAPGIITYKGTQIANLPIITGTESDNTLYLRDNAAAARQILIYGEAGTSRDYYVKSWGENVNAGDTAGTVTLAGVNNYTGELTLTFKIYARDLTANAAAFNVLLETSEALGYDAARQGYYFTGSRIAPGVATVTDTGLTAQLEEGVDFSVGYGENVNVRSGGSVILTGIGNYTGTLTRAFTILPIPQQVTLEDPGADSYNDSVLAPESIATDPSQEIYAQYEFDGSGQTIRLTAYSTAIYPLNAPPQVTFKFMNSKGVPLSLVVSGYSVEIVEIEGVTLAKTTAVFTNGSNYGVIRVYAEAYDEGGNYEDYNYSAGDAEYRLFAKHADSVDPVYFSTAYSYVYGNDNFTIRPGLASYAATKGAFQYSIASDDPSVVDVSITASGANRDVKIAGAGKATVTISHGGYVGADDTQAYLKFSVTTEVTIEKRALVVSAKPMTISYGTSLTAADFEITYTTSARNDDYTGLNYAPGHSDLPEEIFGLGGVTVAYTSTSMSEVREEPYEVGVSKVISVDYGEKSKNYDISYAPTTLTVTKRAATLYVTQNGVNDRLVKVYGAENPTGYEFGVVGIVAGDFDTIKSDWQYGNYASPVIDFMGIDASTDAGSYIVKITGATAKNYEFEDVEITLIIEQAPVIISLESVSVDYDGKAHSAGAVTVSGVANGTVPVGAADAGRLTFDYGYSTGYSYEAPTNAGVYSVRVTFTAESNDNYKTTVTEFMSALTINRVAPVISYNGVRQLPYSTSGISKAAVAAIVSGIDGGSTPIVTSVSSYKFRKAGTDDPFEAPSEIGNYYVLTAGVYDVLAIYDSNEYDNYCDAEVYIYAVFDGDGVLSEGLEIAAGFAEISVKEETKSKVYDGQPVSFDLSEDFDAIVYTDPVSGVQTKLDKGNATLYFQYGDATTGSVNDIPGIHAYVTTVAPTDAGIYTVWVVYDESGVPEDDRIASRTVTSFVGAVVIERYDLAKNNGISFSAGYQPPVYTYDALTHTVAADDIALTGVTGGSLPAGTVSLRYVKGGVYYDMPVNAGSYTVMVRYTAAADDNYTSSAEWVEIGVGLTINKAMVTLNYTRNDVYSFTGESRGITAECLGVTLPGGMREVPKGTLVYNYILNGDYISGLPVDAGVYNVQVTYSPTSDDNYNEAVMTFYNVITISAVKPSIVIQLVSVDFGATIDPASLYTLKGAQFDSEGPVLEYNGIPTVVVSYGTRYTTATGSVDYEWTTTVPTTPGDYSVKVVFTHALNDANYQDVSATRYDCLKIANAVPTISLEAREAVYSGKAFPANAAMITDANGEVYVKNNGATDDGNYYYGNLNYEYRLSGSSVWTAIAPSAAGSYDVRVTYVPNPAKDVFSAGTATFAGALTLRELTITVIPVFGQGKTYDGVAAGSDNLAYLYSYESVDADGNTYVYFVYSALTDADGNGTVDVSKFDFVDEDGNVFTVSNGSGETWRDYYETAIRLLRGVFSVDSQEYVVDLASFGATRGEFEYVDPDTGVKYVIDLDSDVVYPADNAKSYAYDIEVGYYISSVDGEGRVTVINIPKKEIVYTDIEAGLATYTRNEGGRYVVYKLDLNAMTAVSGGVTYKIYEQIGKFAANIGGKTEIVSIDFNNMYSIDASSNTGLYKSSNGALYVIDFASASATEVYELGISEIAIGYKDADGNITYSEALAVEDLLYAGYASEYVRKYTVDGHNAIVYLKERVARIELFYEVKDGGNGVYEFNGMVVGKSEMAVTEYKDVYVYDLLYVCYYVDFNTMTARLASERFFTDLTQGVITGVLDGKDVSLKVTPAEAEYKIYSAGEITGTTSLYDSEYSVWAPELIGNNAWSGSLGMLAADAGEYDVKLGNLNAGSNYKVVFGSTAINYTIGKVKLTVSFVPDPDVYFDGNNKGVEYELEGVLAGDEVRASLTYYGDSYNVSEEGYHVTLNVDSVNYYIENAVSPTYYILPAEMSAPVYDEALTSVIYDGGRHSVPVTAADDATVYYNGSLSVPYYTEPGTYLITVSVEKRNYVTVTIEIRLTISKSVYTVVPNQVPGTLRYGDALPALTSNSTLGSIALDPGQTLMPGDNTYTWTFTPYDADFYRYYEAADGSGNITGTIVLHVEKAKAEITVDGNLTQSETNPVAITGNINGVLDLAGSEGVTVEYIDSAGNRYSTMPTEAGRYTILVTYEGDDLYERTIEYFTLTIEKETNLTWLYYVIGALVLLGGLSTVFFLMRRNKKYE